MLKLEHSKAASRKPLVFHPYLLALFPIASLYSTNISKLSLWDLIRPSVVSVFCVFLLSTILWIFFRNYHKRGLVTSLLVVPLFLQNLIYNLDVKIFTTFPESFELIENVLAVAVTVSFAMSILFVFLSARSFRGATSLLNMISVCILFVACFSSLVTIIHQNVVDSETDDFDFAINTTQAQRENPDIYHILLDAYGGQETLAKFYNHDNSDFLASLRQRGFHVVNGAFSNYHWTDMSTASMLNLDYHAGSEGPVSKIPTRTLIRDNRVRRFLEKRGYSFISFATGYSPTEIHNADRYLQPRLSLTEFDLVLLEHTPFRMFLKPGMGLAPIEARLIRKIAWFESIREWLKKQTHRLHRERISFIFDSLETIGPEPGPQFVFAHIQCPHGPFVFDKDGKPIAPQRGKRWMKNFRKLFREQVQFVSNRILEVIDKIQGHSPDAIIVLHGDHGPRSMGTKASGNWENFVHERTSVLLALYTPNQDIAAELGSSVSLVNTYRGLFNLYYGAQLEMLEDVTYVAPIGQAFADAKVEHIRVTNPF